MFKGFSTKHPLAFTTILFFAALIAVLPLMLVIQGLGQSTDVAAALGRLVVGALIMVLFHWCFDAKSLLTGLPLALPALAFVVWNLAYNLLGGALLISPSAIVGALLMALAPAVFEEAIFRGVGIRALRDNGKTDMQALILSAALFGAIHLTNAVGADLPSTIVQVGYSFVIGLVFGAIYLVSNDIATVICAHAVIDLSSQLFATHPSTTSIPILVACVVMLAFETAYALWLMKTNSELRRS